MATLLFDDVKSFFFLIRPVHTDKCLVRGPLIMSELRD